MAQPPSSRTDPLKPSLSATGVLRAHPADSGPETDVAQLAAHFAAQTGGGLSPELSNDLALEIVFNEIVVQACLTTGATGAAIALERDGEMVCRGSSGSTAPALGSRLDAATGLSGECIRTRQTQRVDDVLTDPRVDREASQRLGIRSVMVMPLLQKDKVVGLFELFSSLPQAFGERDERTAEALGARILSNLELAEQPLPPPKPWPSALTPQTSATESAAAQMLAPEIAASRLPKPLLPEPQLPEPQLPVAQNEFLPIPAEVDLPEFSESATPEKAPQRGVDAVTWALRGAVVVCAVMLGLLLGWHVVKPKAIVRRPPLAPAPATINPAPASTAGTPSSAAPVGTGASAEPESPGSARPSVNSSFAAREKSVPPGSLQVFENGKEIFRMPPAKNQAEPNSADEVQRASSAEPETGDQLSAVPEGSLVRRVEPEYPANALQQRIEGTVVLDVKIGEDGAVQEVKSLSGPPELAGAAMTAVKQWRFKPRRVNGQPAPMQTRVTLNFRLPQ